MRKPEIEIVKFDSSDVIATSGKSPSLTVSYFNDGTKNNLEVDFNGKVHTSYDSLNSALDSVGLFNQTRTDRPAAYSNDGKNFYNYFEYYSQFDGTGQHPLNSNVNGTYTWYGDQTRWIHD